MPEVPQDWQGREVFRDPQGREMVPDKGYDWDRCGTIKQHRSQSYPEVFRDPQGREMVPDKGYDWDRCGTIIRRSQ